MKKVTILVIRALLCCIPYAQAREKVIVHKVFDAVSPFTAALGATGECAVINLSDAKGTFSFHYILASVLGTPAVDFTYSICSTADGTFILPASGSTVKASASSNDIASFSPVLGKYMKIKYWGNATNATDTSINAWLIWTIEE